MDMDKRYLHQQCEQEARDLWEKEGVYKFQSDSLKEVYSIDTPPPTVSGTLHIGHVFSYTHADLIARYKRMKGYNVYYPMGYDDNGLPTERFVEKKHQTKAHLMRRSDFIELCLEETHEVEKLFENLWRTMGLSVDWSKVYSTISPEVRRISQRSFIELYQKNLVYRQLEPSLFCTTCRTSVAQAELDSIEVKSTFNDIIFEAESGDQLKISTTRPELLPACVAVFYHPNDDRYKHLEGKEAITPVFNNRVKILPDPDVDPEKGTGLVMCCTFGDQTDIHWYKTHKLPLIQIVGFDGRWTEEAGPLAGLRVHEARKEVLDLLKAEGKLAQQKQISHAVNAHERCKQEIEYLVLAQWFVKILEHKEEFLKRADQINWKPGFMKYRYIDWVGNLHWDWCISRQRFFGIPFPAWHCVDCGQVLLPEPTDLPVDPQEQPYPGGQCTKCGSRSINPDTDVMDTWNTSGLTPQINLKWPEKSPDQLELPMSMRPQAHDIIRTWAFYTIVKAHYHNNSIPWKDIVISGHVLSGKGDKISKSKGGVKLTPEALLEQYPADVIRYWSANGRPGTDTAFSDNQLRIGNKLLTKMWNAFRFISQHLGDGRLKGVNIGDQLNRWLLHKVTETYKIYQKNFDAYEYQMALETIERFFWQDFCDNYLELVKDRLFNPQNYDQSIVDATRFGLYQTGYAIIQMFAPFIPHLTETLYQKFYRQHEKIISLHNSTFDNHRFSDNFPESVQLIDKVLDIVATVRKLKSEKQVSLKTSIEQLIIYTSDQALIKLLSNQLELLAGITKSQSVVFDQAELDDSVVSEDDGKLFVKVKV